MATRDAPEDEGLLTLRFALPDSGPIDVECERKYVGSSGTMNYPFLIGAEFIMIGTDDRKAVDAFVAGRSKLQSRKG